MVGVGVQEQRLTIPLAQRDFMQGAAYSQLDTISCYAARLKRSWESWMILLGAGQQHEQCSRDDSEISLRCATSEPFGLLKIDIVSVSS